MTRGGAFFAAALLLGGCAGARSARAPAHGARAALEALVVQNDAGAARARTEGASGLVARGPGEPWARLAAALLARRALDRGAEAGHLLALAEAVPGEPLALVALRRLAELAEDSPALARRIEAALAPPLAAGRFAGLAAYRARVARVTAAEVLGDHEGAARLRAENGAVSAWSIAGPFASRRRDFERPFPPDGGVLPERVDAPLGGVPRATRTLPAPDGSVGLDGEPSDGDVFYLASDVALERGGRYLVTLGTALSARVAVDGVVVHLRRDYAAHEPTVAHVPVALAPGRHRVVVKAARTGVRPLLHLAFSREDGSASDATFSPAVPATPPPGAAPPEVAAPVHAVRSLAVALERDAGAALARLLAGVDAASVDRETAKALVAEAADLLPGSAAVRVARAGLFAADPSLDEQVARARAEGELRQALARDPGHAEARVALAALLREAGRLDEADDALPPGGNGAGPPPAAVLASQARSAEARGLRERAEQLAVEAIAAGGDCRTLELARDLAARRRAVSLEDERARALAECRDGRERLAEHLRRRGDPAGAVAALAPLVRARPWAIEPSFALADAHVAAGEPGRAVAALEALRAVWPRSGRVEKRLADARELAGDAAGARAARERALALDGGDLPLRRLLSLEDGREVLQEWAEGAASAIRAYEAARRSDDTSSALVLDAAAVELHPGGAATERIHQVIHVLDTEGVEQFGEVRIPPGAEVIALRTRKPDGRALEPERLGASKGTASLSGLAPGDYVEFEYLRGVRGNGSGAAGDAFYFRAEGSRLFRSTYVVVAPEGLAVGVDARAVQAPEAARERGLQIFRLEAHDVPAHVPEPNQPSLTELLPFVQLGVGGGREAIHADLADAFAGRARPTEELRALARRVRGEAGPDAPPRALAAAAWTRVSREILGQGGSFADEASATLSRGRGSRLLVLKAVLAELGLRARIALARSFGADQAPRRFPSHVTWSDALLRIEAGGEVIWHDPSLRAAPFGTIPSAVLGVEALVLGEPGEPLEVVRTPERSAIEERRSVTVRVAITPDGSASVEGEDRYLGAAGAAAKGGVERLDSSERRQVVEAMLARSFRGLSLSSVELLGEDDPAAPLTIRWRGTVPHLARETNGGLVVDAAILPAQLGARLVQLAARATPLLLEMPEVVDQRVEITAPAGFAAQAAPPAAVDGPFGAFSRTERADGGTLVREDRYVVRRARIPPERYPEFASFAAALDQLQERPAAFARREVPGAAPAGSAGPDAPRR